MSRTAVFFLVSVAPGLSLILALLGLETLKGNLLGWVLVLTGIAYSAGVIIVYWIRNTSFWQGSGKAAREEAGDRSFWAILPGMLVCFFASPLEYIYLDPMLPRTSWMQILGLALLLPGMALRLWTRRAIKGMYSGHVQVVDDHTLVTTGPYRYIRHPGYAGLVLLCLGIAAGYSSLIGLGAIPLLLMPGLAYRMRVEDDLLEAHFGEDFRLYARRVRKLIPGIW